MHTVAIVALDGVVPFDLSIPTEVFRHVRLPFGGPGYQVRVCGLTPEVHAGAFRVKTHYGLGALARADTIILPGITDVSGPVPPRLVKVLRAAAGRGTRIASICSGAFLLAATGLLDGLRATTHWMATEELARRFPSIQVDPNVLYVDNGQFLTSAGAAAGLDLCLHMVRRDHGAAVAADAARLAVMPLERDGGQSQFITHVPPAPEGASLEPLLHWMEDHLDRPLTLPALARKAAMSERTLSRRFREQTGTTPLQWLLHARVRRAQYLLETTEQSVEAVAEEVGFGSPTSFREHFQRFVTTSPLAYRRAFRGAERLSAGGRSAPPPPGAPRQRRAAS
ncbi:helix-turn-helix domain-containing protein [Corallococcus exiguus]|uniref:Helix-turn-helix domain-containing protein n=1 Tax=Corallococcus exiguus TaxID=83462 RepID=A0A7X4YHD7_9BACT|nr:MULTISPECIES: helix-turn-helix domain-containing protein [Corallococcus]NBC45296.1 helix-turn-helix domain-containing protein [Corallococcus exiguus]NNC14823.1 helix-turn-helix domain-containing protein [Corallococcus exiguus]NRD56194.1 helix-turn-helix domain-containing protein [Corallococcus exiguus]NRD63111.1 helix-turn-helix domain-containing protein [Corallococcus exiguus]RKH22424.1 helix-turn-helix domain-containing protein [Corallococcus sp. CA041A]